jgi:predicted acylesterase/phospholipase RssA
MIARQHAAVEAPDRERRALVLAGGGIIGMFYEIGVLAALEEALPPGPFGQHFDLFVGTSAGAVTAAFVANGAQPSEMFRALRDDLDSPFNFQPEDVFGTPAGTMIQLFTQFARPLLGAVGGAIRRGSRATLASTLADFQAHSPPGFYSTEPLERALCARFTALGYAHHFPALPRPLYVTGVDIDTAERLVFGTDELAEVHVCRAVAASSAIPIFFEPIRIGERDVVDGAVAGAPPIDVAAERGARHIVYVNPLVPIRNDRGKVCFPLGAGGCGRLRDRGIGWIADQTLRMILAAQLPAALVAVQARYPGLVVQSIAPCPDELPMFLHHAMSFGARRELLEYGYACGQRTAPAAPRSPSAQRGFVP